MCRAIGNQTKATHVDHIEPHKGDQRLMWNKLNWQPLCAHCHNSHKQSQDRTGVLRGVDTAGIPLDPNHEWNKVRAAK